MRKAGLRFVTLTALSASGFIPAPSLFAQWLAYPTAGVPRNPDGTANLNAPSPRAADGKPDFSGLWEPFKNNPCPPEGCEDIQVPKEFGNIGWSLKEGLPYTPWAAALKKTRMAHMRIDDPATNCLPVGVVATHTQPLLKRWIQAPDRIAILNERYASYRQIFTDGRPLQNDPQPTWNGYSTGKWEGDTLVVHSNGFRDDGWLDRGGSPSTEAMKLTERIRRPNYGRMEIEITVDDSKAYTKPWTINFVQTIVLNTELLDYNCLENEKDRPHLSDK
jgi:hypothetical protein